MQSYINGNLYLEHAYIYNYICIDAIRGLVELYVLVLLNMFLLILTLLIQMLENMLEKKLS